MAKTRRSAIVTSDGILDLPENTSVRINEEYGAPEVHGHLVVSTRSDMENALAQELWLQGQYEMIIGKSGSSRVGMHVTARPEGDASFDTRNHKIALPVSILSLRAVQVRQNGIRDDLLTVLQEMTDERDVPIGRLLLADPNDALTKGQILQAVKQNKMAFALNNKNLKKAIDEDGVLNLPLEDLQYMFCEDNFRTDQKRNVIRYGKHGLSGVQAEKYGIPKALDGKEFFVGGIRLSIGPFIAVIDEQTNNPEVVHLAARVLDGVRTTGLSVPRQIELFNKLYDAVTTEDLRVRLRFYFASKDVQDFSYGVVNKKTIVEGVDLADVLQLQQYPEILYDMMTEVSPGVADGNPAGYMVGSGRAHKIPWVENACPEFQSAHLKNVAPKFSAGDSDYCVRGNEMPQPAVELARRLGYVGKSQAHSKMYLSYGFPDMETIEHMHDGGIGVFVAHNIRDHADAYSSDKPLTESDEHLEVNDLFMTDREFAALQTLHKKGVQFLTVRHESVDKFGETGVIPEQVMEWHERGFWVAPEDREAVDKVSNVITMYGSHVKGTDKALEPQLARFAIRMKKLFGDSLAFMHGRGGGVMYLADKVARNLPQYIEEGDEPVEPAVSIGVGIDLEQVGQEINHHPEAQMNFRAQSRLIRQKHMNDRAVFNIFNLGGAGTLEEVALTLCSQKLYKNLLTPMIFVDPFGISNEGENFWNKLKAFIADISTKKTVTINNEEIDTSTLEIPIQLLQGHMQNMVHVVDSYDEAADIIEGFVGDPVGYYLRADVTKEEFVWSYENAVDVRKDTRFTMPTWIQGSEYAELLNDERWDTRES